MLFRLSRPLRVVRVSLANDLLIPADITVLLEEMHDSKNCHIGLLSKFFACNGINDVIICATISLDFPSLHSSRQSLANLKMVSVSLFVVSLENNGEILIVVDSS